MDTECHISQLLRSPLSGHLGRFLARIIYQAVCVRFNLFQTDDLSSP